MHRRQPSEPSSSRRRTTKPLCRRLTRCESLSFGLLAAQAIALSFLLCPGFTATGPGTAAVVHTEVPVNLNIRSAILSRALGAEAEAAESRNSFNQHEPRDYVGGTRGTRDYSETSEQERGTEVSSDASCSPTSLGGVSLDLSGRFDCHVASPRHLLSIENGRPILEDGGLTPLFRFGTAGPGGTLFPFPSLHVGARYDFSAVWYGATSVFGTLSWRGLGGSWTVAEEEGSAINKRGWLGDRFRRKLSSCALTAGAEQSLLDPSDRSAEVSLAAAPPFLRGGDGEGEGNFALLSPPSSLSVRIDAGGLTPKATLSLLARLHKRVRFVSKSTVLLDETLDNAGPSPFVDRVPRWSPDNESAESWMPDLRLSATGRLVSRSDIGFKPFGLGDERATSRGRGRRPMFSKTGARLMVSKQLDWTAWAGVGGMPSDDEGGNAFIRLELCGLDASEDGLTTVIFETELERPIDAARLTLAQEQLIRSL